jgi:hypothetical protein
MVSFEESKVTMRDARAAYFTENGFGDDGGYGAKWVDFKLGPLPFPFPNTAARVRAVRYHDLHHVLTGYRTDFLGELEISAWEIGAGCKDFWAAWQLNLGGLAGGALMIPRRTFRAFVRGRHAESLYGLPLEELLDATVADVRAKLGVEAAPRATVADVLAFVGAVGVGLAVGLLTFALVVPLLPVGLVALNVRRAVST